MSSCIIVSFREYFPKLKTQLNFTLTHKTTREFWVEFSRVPGLPSDNQPSPSPRHCGSHKCFQRQLSVVPEVEGTAPLPLAVEMDPYSCPRNCPSSPSGKRCYWGIQRAARIASFSGVPWLFIPFIHRKGYVSVKLMLLNGGQRKRLIIDINTRGVVPLGPVQSPISSRTIEDSWCICCICSIR
jgi:hypothetical protein